MVIIYLFAGLYILAMLFILLYSMAQAHLLFHFLRHQRLPTIPEPDAPEEWPQVTVQLPVYNERYVAERLITAVASLNYPREKLEIQILDDSTDITQQLIREKLKEFPGVNFEYIHRTDRVGFKAGALKNALTTARGEFIAVFDADFVPDPNFLLKTLPYFNQPDIGMVQSRWTHLNRDYSILTKLQAFALDAHFLVEQIGRNRQNAFINFNGTGGIWRKACILDSGNWQDDTLTEDLDLSYRAQQRGWKFVYRPDIESPAELPPVMSAIKSQQYRWTKGGAECAVKHIRDVWKNRFSLRVKLHALAHLFNSAIFVAIWLGSIGSIAVWWAAYKGWIDPALFRAGAVFLLGFVMITLVYIVAFFHTQGRSFRKSGQLIWQLPLFLSVSMGLSLHNARAVCQGLWGKKTSFVRTPKFNLGLERESWRKNTYRQHEMPFLTFMEGGMALLFLVIAALSIKFEMYLMLPFHLMLALGYAVVFFTSYKSYKALS